MSNIESRQLAKPEKVSLPRFTVAMLGARRHYAVPRILIEAGLLERFSTDSYSGNKPWVSALLKSIPGKFRPRVIQRWLGRADALLAPKKVKSFEFLGWWYAWARNRARTSVSKDFVKVKVSKRFNRRIVSRGLHEPGVLWGFNGAALELFQAAKKRRGIRCILEQTILPKRQELALIQEEIRRWPDWQLDITRQNCPDPISQREEEEWELADVILAGSDFVAQGLRAYGVPSDKIQIVPYGVDASRFQPVNRSKRAGPLRILFAGEVGLRKGVPYLLQALRDIGEKKVRARIAGRLALVREQIAPYGDVAEFMGPVPRPAMAKLFGWADVLVLPSIVEGSATVTYEALANGLPVVTTPNAGSVVRNGVEGFILAIRDVSALKDCIEQMSANRSLVSQIGAAARERALDFTLDKYRDRLLGAVGALG